MLIWFQLKPSKWPLRIRSPMGEGALRGLVAPVLMVAERRGLPSGRGDSAIGDIAEFGGGLGGDLALTDVSSWG